MYDVVITKFTFAISSPDEFLVLSLWWIKRGQMDQNIWGPNTVGLRTQVLDVHSQLWLTPEPVGKFGWNNPSKTLRRQISLLSVACRTQLLKHCVRTFGSLCVYRFRQIYNRQYLPPCPMRRLPTIRLPMLRLPMKARGYICQYHQNNGSSSSSYHLRLPPPLHINRPLLTIHPRGFSRSSNRVSSWLQVFKLRWSWEKANMFSLTWTTSRCHVSSSGAARGHVDSLPSAWPVSKTTVPLCLTLNRRLVILKSWPGLESELRSELDLYSDSHSD